MAQSLRGKLLENNKWRSVPHGYLLQKNLFPIVKSLSTNEDTELLLLPKKLSQEDLPEFEKLLQLLPLVNSILPKNITKTMDFQRLWNTSNQHSTPARILAKNIDWFIAYREIYDECQVSISSFKKTALGFVVIAPTEFHACVAEGLLLCTMNIRVKKNTTCAIHGVYTGKGCPQCKDIKEVDKRFNGWIRKLVHKKNITPAEKEVLRRKYAHLKEFHKPEVAYQLVRDSLVSSGKIRKYRK